MSGEEEGFRRGGFNACTEVSMFCPVEATVLGYYPNLGSGVFFTVAFGMCMLGSGALGIWKQTWTFGAAMTVALGLETAGYIGRVFLNDNPWNKDAFQLQICAIILAPTLICAAIYLTLKHVSLALNPSLSRIPPKWYPRFFLPADLSCLIIQAIGGSVAAAAKHDQKTLLDHGNNLIIAGIVLQVVVLGMFGGMGLDYYIRVKKHFRSGEADPAALEVWRNKKFRLFGIGVMISYFAIFIRCIYRIAEMSGGWGSEIMRDEISFLILDPTLILVASGLLTIFHPGVFFPQMRNGWRKTDKPATTTAPDLEASKGTPADTGESGTETPQAQVKA